MRDDSDKKEREFTGTLDVSDELCADGSEALSYNTDDDDEFIIKNRKAVRRLMKYAYAQVHIAIRGYIVRDATGLNILYVTGYTPPVREKNSSKFEPYDELEEERTRKKRRKKHPEDITDNDGNSLPPEFSSIEEIDENATSSFACEDENPYEVSASDDEDDNQ